jgi:glycosyltransferase involved in cell wall biosynthesis
MSKSYKVSVVIPCFNHGEFVEEAVESVTRAGRDDLELIVVDDGSTDERTGREMDALAARGIKVIRQENKGLAGARNAGILASQAEYIFPLDADDRLHPGWIDGAIQLLDSDGKVGVVYGDAECFGTRTGRWHTGPFDASQLMQSNYIHCSALYRRVIWEQNGGYDGAMPVQGAEDWDFWLSTVEHGWQFAYVPEILFDYRIAEQSMITRLRGSGLMGQLEQFVAEKHGLLYRRAWQSLLSERQSGRGVSRQLVKLLASRVKEKLFGSQRVKAEA